MLQIVEWEITEVSGKLRKRQQPSWKSVPEEPWAGLSMKYPILYYLVKRKEVVITQALTPLKPSTPEEGGGVT